jgi:hypothetical protein
MEATTHARYPAPTVTTIETQEPMETMALDCSLPYPSEATRDGEYEFMVVTGAMAVMMMRTCGSNLQFVN